MSDFPYGHDGKVYDSLGISAGTFQRDDKQVEVVGILFPKANPLHEDDFDEIHMTLPAAKALLIDLKGAIESCMKHQDGN